MIVVGTACCGVFCNANRQLRKKNVDEGLLNEFPQVTSCVP